VDARVRFFGWRGTVVRCGRVCGLDKRPFQRRGPVWRCADRVPIGLAHSEVLGGLVRSERRDVVSVYELMTANRAMSSISTMSRTLGVSRAGYYAWLERAPSARSQADAELTDRIAAIHKASRETCGAPRIHAELIDEGVRVGRKRVKRLMKAAGIAGVSRRKGARTTFRDERVRPASDLVDRNFHADEPNQLWVADITYVPTWAGFIYLAVVLDAFSRRIVGWAMGHDLKAQLHKTGGTPNRNVLGCFPPK